MKLRLNFFAVLLIVLFISVNNDAYARRVSSRQKECFSNMRVIQGAVEMYNMDIVTNKMSVLDIDKLIEGKYLKSQPSHPEVSCKYLNIDMLDGEGFVYCDYHGYIDAPEVKLHPSMTINDFKMAVEVFENEKRMKEEKRNEAVKRERLKLLIMTVVIIGVMISIIITPINTTNKNKTST